MISYCVNESACRRKLIAKYFDEVWQSSDCNQMCDICTRPSTFISKRNCREEAAIIIDFLQANRKQRFTPLKLIEQITIKSMIKIDLQRLILQMIMEQYLKEDFHFTPYSTICYVVPGAKARYVHEDHCQIPLDLIESTKKRTSINVKTEEKATVKKKSPSAKLPGMIAFSGNEIFHAHSSDWKFCIDYLPSEHLIRAMRHPDCTCF